MRGGIRRHKVGFRPRAVADLFGLYRYISDQAGPVVAGAYIDRIEAACLALESFPVGGTRRDDIRPGLRSMGFEDRATIVFRVTPSEVDIVRVFYGSQDYARAIRAMREE